MSKKLDEIAKRQMEEELYRVVADELKNDIIREGLMAKALVQSSGNKEQARLLYMQYRIQSIIDEVSVREAEEERAAAENKRRRLEENKRRRLEERKAQENRDYENWRISQQNKSWLAKAGEGFEKLFVFLGVALCFIVLLGLLGMF